MEINEEKINEYRELLVKAGYSEKTIREHVSAIDGFLFLYGDDLSDENIEEYANDALSYGSRKTRKRSLKMFEKWILRGIKPQRLKRSVYDKAKEEVPKETPPKEITTDCRYWDNMYNKPAFYKDSHSAQWC